MKPAEIYDLLCKGQSVSFAIADRKQFNVLRVSLHRHHKLMVDIGGTEDSLCASYDNNTCKATFHLGPRVKQNNWTILLEESTDDGTEIHGPLAKGDGKGGSVHYLPNARRKSS
jgi:hypothetical protein